MLDQHGRSVTYLRLSVTEHCNLRCRYCMPEEGAARKRCDAMLTGEELLAAVRAAASLGVTKLRITGGEPLLRPDILSICRSAASVDGIREVCVTTNGLLLPRMAKALREAGVRRVNLSLDTLDPARYAHITRGGALHDALAGLHAALDAGFDRVKINAVLIGGFSDGEIENLAELTQRYPVDVRFIELMPMVDGAAFGRAAYIPCQTVLDRLPQAVPVDQDGGVARLYRLPGAQGDIGLISPVSDGFCGACNRIRITADGHVKPCLHSAQELCIKGLTEPEMRAVLERAIREKPACHGGLSAQSRSRAGRDMNQIGG